MTMFADDAWKQRLKVGWQVLKVLKVVGLRSVEGENIVEEGGVFLSWRHLGQLENSAPPSVDSGQVKLSECVATAACAGWEVQLGCAGPLRIVHRHDAQQCMAGRTGVM